MKKFFIFLLLFSFFINTTLAQFINEKNDSTTNTQIKPICIGKTFLQYQKHIWTSPFRIKKKDLLYLLPVALAATTAIVYDEDIHRNIMQFKTNNAWVKDVSPVFTNGGEISVVGGISAAFYLTGFVLKDDKAMQTGAIAGYALVNSAVVVSILKMIAGRERPRVDATNTWHPFPESLKQFSGTSSDYYASFPSGHSIAAFTLATVIAEQYKETKIIPFIMYTLASGVALSRTTENAHWLSDVIVGSALGYGIGKYMVKHHKQTKWFLFPSQSGGCLMVTGIYRL
ncbi:MAG: phosphatase PAP2 family protein [Bacteroidetes bacterium]|nr:phosphatase PAP2 family protein [Bacteroidota bacterium]